MVDSLHADTHTQTQLEREVWREWKGTLCEVRGVFVG
jgi:hypothetical protein